MNVTDSFLARKYTRFFFFPGMESGQASSQAYHDANDFNSLTQYLRSENASWKIYGAFQFSHFLCVEAGAYPRTLTGNTAGAIERCATQRTKREFQELHSFVYTLQFVIRVNQSPIHRPTISLLL